MRILTIRNVPEATYRAIAGRAERHRRSLQQEALLLLERAQLLEAATTLERARALRSKLVGRRLGDTVREVRQDRSR